MGSGRRGYEPVGKKLNIFKVIAVIVLIIATIAGVIFLVKYNKNDENSKSANVEEKIVEELNVEEKTIEDIVAEFGGEVKEQIKPDTYHITKDGKDYTAYLDGEIAEGIVVPWDGSSQKPAIDEVGNINIYNAAELKWIADQVISGEKNFAGVTITLRNSIDLGAREDEEGNWEGTQWTPIIGFLNSEDAANQEQEDIPYDENVEVIKENLKRFAGVFDGNNFSIRGLYINSDKAYQGLFGYQTGIVTRVVLKNSCIHGNEAVGAIVGLNGGTVQNCSIQNVEVKGNEKVGGLVGITMSSSNIEECSSLGENNIVTAEKYVGGLIGYTNNNANITNSTNRTNVTGSNYVGGISGISFYATVIKNSSNLAKNIIGEEYVGGLVGYSQSQIENSSNNTLIEQVGIVQGKNYVGGLVGLNYLMGNITDSYNAGKVIVEKDNCGGLVGLNNANISNCYNIGEIDASAAEGVKLGGLCGQNLSESYIYSSYNTGKMKFKALAGGTVGADFGTMSNCFYLDNCFSVKIQNTEEARTEEEIKNAIITELGDGFKQDEENKNSGYPILLWQ